LLCGIGFCPGVLALIFSASQKVPARALRKCCFGTIVCTNPNTVCEVFGGKLYRKSCVFGHYSISSQRNVNSRLGPISMGLFTLPIVSLHRISDLTSGSKIERCGVACRCRRGPKKGEPSSSTEPKGSHRKLLVRLRWPVSCPSFRCAFYSLLQHK